MNRQPNSRDCFVCGVESPVGLKLTFDDDGVGEVRCEYVYVLSAATMRMTAADGSTKVVELGAGQVSFGPPTMHSGENIGMTTLHELIIELK